MRYRTVFALMVSAAGIANTAQAVAIITNASFENPATSSSSTFLSPINDWSTFGSTNFAGVIYDAPHTIYTNTDGNQFATLVNNTGIFQDIGSSGAGTYTFSVGIAAEPGHAGNSTDLLEIKLENSAGGVLNTTIVLPASLSGTVFTEFSVSALVNPAIAGIRVTIFSGPTGTGTEYAVDNASITFSPIPEPTAYLLFGLGSIGVLRRRRQTS